jgi:hypothetical protein
VKRALLPALALFVLASPAFAQAPAVLFVDAATNSPSGAPGRYRALKLFRSRYSPEEYGALRAAREAEERADRAPLRLEGPGVAALFGGREFGDGLSNALARAVEPAPTDDLYTEFSRTTVDVSGAPEEWTVESTTRRRILTYAGQRKAGDLTFRWNPATSDFEVVDARVIAPDGTETPIDPKLDLFEGDQEWVADAPRYPAGKLATVSFPKLAPGMSVQWTTRRRAHDRDLFSFSETLGSFGSFGEISVTVAGTNDLVRAFRVQAPFWKTVADRFPVETNETDGATTYLVRGGGPGSQIVSEPNMPPLSRLAPVLRASSQTAAERARDIAARMWALSDPGVQTNAAALARSLVPGGVDPNARRRLHDSAEDAVVDPGRGLGAAVVAIRDWCAVNLREAGPAYWDLPLSALSPADATLEARYGHEADIRILQFAMLRALGLGERVRLRLYDADWDGAPPAARVLSFASPSTFDTLAFEVRSDSDLWFLDDATQYAPPLASRNEGRAFLAVSFPPGAGGPRPGMPEPVIWEDVFEDGSNGWSDGWGPRYPSQSGTETEYTIRVREDGSAEIGVAVSHSGSDYEAFRKRYEEILPEERRRDAQRLAASIAQSAKLQGDVATETPSNGPCTRLVFAVEVPDFAVRDGDRLVFRLPGALPLSPQARARRFPYRRASEALSCTACRVWVPYGWRVAAAPPEVRFGFPEEVLLPSGSVFTAPGRNADEGFSWKNPNALEGARASYAREVVDDEPAGLLWIRTRRRLERAEFDASLFPAFQRDALRTHGPDAETVILERAPSAN